MKRFLFDILLFALLVLGIAIVGDLIVSYGLRQTTIRKYAVWNDIYQGNDLDNDLVFVGSSSCMVGFNPLIVDSILGISSYNLAINGHAWYPCQSLRYDTYVHYAKQPKYVVIVIDNSTFSIDDTPLEREQFFPYFWMDDSLISSIRSCKEISFMERYCPMWRYIGYRDEIENGVLSTFGRKHFDDDNIYKGYVGYDYSWDRTRLDNLTTIHLDVYPDIVNSFLLFIEQRKKAGQIVVLVNRPEYYEVLDHYTNRDEMAALYDSIAAVAGVEYLDYWDEPSIVRDSTYFYNTTHLNIIGSEFMSIKFAHDLDSLVCIVR